MTSSTQSRQRVLVVDDETSVRQTLRMILACEGYQVQTADSGQEALTILNNQKHDLVVTDFRMSGMKGDELAKIIRERWPEIGVVMITACADSLRSSSAKLPGVDALIGKPFVVEQFRQTISRLLVETKPDDNTTN